MDRPIRSLLAWLDQNEAVRTLLGHVPQDGADVAAQVAVWSEKQAVRAARAPYQEAALQIEPLPAVLEARAAAFTQRADVQGPFAGLQWQLGVVDLSNVLSYQKVVVLEQAQERVAGAVQDDWGNLFSICLPEAAAATEMPLMLDQDSKGITMSSLNPNLRVIGHAVQTTNVAVAPGGATITVPMVGFLVRLGVSFVQVVGYNGRWFVRDGYHRCYGLLANDVTRIPCIVINAANFEQTGAAQPTFFPYEVLFSDRPPFLRDFLDDNISVTAQQRATRKVVRVTAQEFVVEV